MSNNLQKSESVTTPAKEASVPKREPVILHIRYVDAVLWFTIVSLLWFALGILIRDVAVVG